MAVIVDDGDAIPLAGAREAALHAAKACERAANLVIGNAKLMRNGNRRGAEGRA
jgi:hypothetical protein